jgi:iron complex outermembrane receptor protein
MNLNRHILAITLATTIAKIAVAQTSANAPEPSTTATSEVVQLPAFEIKGDSDAGYVGKSALSSTRIAVDLLDLPQSVKVLNNALLQAVNPMNMADLLNYVGGAQNGQLFISPGRVNIRGFTGDADYVDGFSPPANSNPESANFDRFEVVKGPSTIFLAADGSPGGVVNKITKNPLAEASTSIAVQAGRYDANAVTLDSTGSITTDRRLLYRMVLADHHADSFYDWWYTHRVTAMPALSYQLGSQTKLVLKALYHEAYTGDFQGLPIDPRTLKVFDLPASSSDSGPPPTHYRHDRQKRLWFNFSSRLNDAIAVRLGGMTASATHHRSVATPQTWNESRNAWAVPNYDGTQSFARSSSVDDDDTNYRDLQSDVNFNFKTGPANHNLLVGGELRASPSHRTTFQSSSTAWNPYVSIPSVITVNRAIITNVVTSDDSNARLFALETVKLFHDKLILSFGVNRSKTSASQLNQLTNAYTTAPYKQFKNLKQWGVVYKIFPTVSIFTGYNENFATNGVGLVNGASGVLPAKQGKQHEVGLKSELLNRKLTVDVSYFDITQSNNSVAAFPTNLLNPRVLIPGVISRGFDGDLTLKVSREFSLLGTFALYNAKSVLGPSALAIVQPYYGAIRTGSIPVANTAEQTASLFGAYTFGSGRLKDLRIGLGTNYQSKRAVTDSANQVMFGYVPGRTLVQLSLDYRLSRHWRYSLNADNLLNRRYIYSVRSENVIIPGAPTNLKASATYTF